jgi:hypothetical protein
MDDLEDRMAILAKRIEVEDDLTKKAELQKKAMVLRLRKQIRDLTRE